MWMPPSATHENARLVCCSLDCQLQAQPLPGADILINITVTVPEKVLAASTSSRSDAKFSAQSVYLVYWVNYKGASTLSTKLMKRDGGAYSINHRICKDFLL